ncbi:transporter substrate-binding domain-containing protein [Pseudomonas sp. SIMBA_077]
MLAQELGVHSSRLITNGDDLLSGVESGKYDVAINHRAMTPELLDRFDFSEPYLESPARTIPPP